MDPIEQFSAHLFEILRHMDAEATVTEKGIPTGLNWYAGHLGVRSTEPAWSQRVAALLRELGYDTQAECRYPNQTRKHCDVVVRKSHIHLWLEIKGAWREYWRKKGNLTTYRSYLLHPLIPKLDASKSHTVPLDLQKLASLKFDHGTHAAVLLVGFDTASHPMGKDVDELVALASLKPPSWHCSVQAWPDPHRPDQRVNCWLWVRAIR